MRLPLAALCVLPAFAQTDASGPAFEVASVKVSPPLPQGVMMFRLGGGPDSADPGRVTYKGSTLKALIARAYGVKDYQVQGPPWLDNEHYDIIATTPRDSTKEQVNLMMQRLLAERFHVTLHHESKPMAVYALSIAKGGPKLEEVDPEKLPAAPAPGSAPPPPPPPPGPGGVMPRGAMPAGAMRMMMSPNGWTLAGNITIDRLCTMLSNLTDRPVIDLTGLKGMYTLNLSWTPDENEKMGGKLAPVMSMHGRGGDPPPVAGTGPTADGANEPGPTLAMALQNNYGLKLEAKKDPADILVIDRADKVPTEN
jgi:uncharacterized protein (TIGR03435 family)